MRLRTITATVGASALLVTPNTALAAEPSQGLRDGYDKIYDRVERLGGEPGRHLAHDGVRTSTGRIRDAQRGDLVRGIDVLRRMQAGLSGAAAGGAAGAAAPAPAGSSAGAGLEGIAACESGGDPSAVSADGTYRGKYQFDQQTWESVGGSGDPAAAPEAEQDARAAALQAQRGSSPWPVCGG